MGSSGYAILDDLGESIEFIESNLGGTGFQGYDNFEKRIEDKISQIILGHSDAIKSIPGKLGNQTSKSQAQLAMDDKQTRDGRFISSIVNKQLIPKLRNLGFEIPIGIKAVLKNDNEEIDIANNFADLAIKINQAGLQIDAEYFKSKTGIPCVVSKENTPNKEVKEISSNTNKLFGKSIIKKLNEIYR